MTMTPTCKVLHLVGDHEDAGGVLSVIRNLQSACDPSRWRHVVWVNKRYSESRQPSLEYRYSDTVQAESTDHWKLFRQTRPAARELRALCRQEPFDIIHAHSRGTLLVTLWYGFWNRRPLIFTNHNYALRTWLYRWAARHPRMHTVVLTPNMADHYGLDLGQARVHQISACYHDSFLECPLIHRKPDSSKRRLIGVGSVIGWKKWDLVVEALGRLPADLRERVEFDIWGPILQLPEAQAYAERLKNTISDRGLSETVRLRGSTDDVIGKLRQSDLFVLPSTNEPCSVALMEALALGLPVIVSASGGCVDLVSESCGLQFEPDNPDSLAETLRNAVLEPGQFAPPETIRESVRSRSASEVFRLYETLYRNITRDTVT